MNMPNLAWCHHCILRTRSLLWSPVCGAVEAPKKTAGSADVGSAAAASEAPVPTSQSRRGIRSSSFMFISLREGCSTFQLENLLHQNPLFTGFGLRQRLLKLPHELLPLLHFGIASVRFRLRGKRKVFVHLHDHEHAGTQQVYLHVFDTSVADAFCNLWPNVLVMPPVLCD